MSDFLVLQIGNELRTDSRLLARFLNHRHRTILENVDKYLPLFSEIGRVPFETGTFQTAGGEQKQRYALLNESQCYFLLTLMRNNDRVVEAKLQLVKAFEDARRQLAKRDSARIEGKKARIAETESIKALVDYASASGSESANKYYVIITKMTNEFLGIESGERNSLSAERLKQIATVELVVDIAIRDGIKAELPYKDIYKLAKERVFSLGVALGVK